ncbi:MAG: BamA/TamA family outer membrane protein [Bacteroidetes bacterium]|nr:BamA/TamA family outer membrane protein [Flavobacteriales bacterium]NOG57492.1 BamA/TamA family outer membrane protein [Bacteroidota bacterium]
MLLIVLCCLMQACSSTRHLKENEQLLTKVKIKYEGPSVLKEELYTISKQKPNRKILGLFRFYLGIYNLYYHKEESKIRNNIGEPPVVYDSSLVPLSADLMHKYLNNRGYYKNKVETSSFLKRKKAKIEYHIKAGPEFKIKSLASEVTDLNIQNIYQSKISKSELKKGAPFDLELLEKERKRIEKDLKNNGYYKFNKEFIQFKVDTFMLSNQAAVKTVILNRPNSEDSTKSKEHKVYVIDKVYVRSNYSQQRIEKLKTDTIMLDSISFIETDEDQIRKSVLTSLINIRPGDIFQQSKQELTYRNLAGLRNFSFVSITYDQDFESSGNGLVAYIDLNPRKQMSYTIQSEGTNNGGNLGVNGNIGFQNINTFKGAEILNVRLSAGVEAQQILTKENEEQAINGLLPFNTFEFGPEVSLEIPRFLLPFKANNISQKGSPRTTFNASYNLQNRPDYVRSVSKTYISYAWNETPTKTHIIQPLDLSLIKLDPSIAFKNVLENIRNPFLKNSYTDNLILASKYSFIVNTQNENKLKNHIYFRMNAESAGNFAAFLNKNFDASNSEVGRRELLGIKYAQYARLDADLRYYDNFKTNKLVYRLYGGVGIPYRNSLAMPFEKSFYAGGANGIRAWQARQLGPGNLPDSSTAAVDQIGNMKLETNVEFRFGITKIFEGAMFVDAGNIWNLNQKDSRKETQFEVNKLWRGTAIGVGVGLRLNFTFFIFRFDIAAPIKDPAESNPESIRAQWRKSNLNFGIGYPF